ncbi:tripartite motif-containing protein 16-like isoform X3 [Cyprinodon tularosa]|uniref:tripartite motif-containing protein 16-like isoform X3 n=1 Tax=Cyprinodon tularosa TaxID=77115 RepID=UPI0018E2824F|nr:tripartite motif-containing protein 16-like isoform X3 [Cyprinodon tularosa]
MELPGDQMDSVKFSCSICLDLLKDPVTIPCGHSYCMNCIKDFWDGEGQRGIFSCPQCRQTSKLRPVLGKNIMLAELVEDLKKNGLQSAAADHCYAGPEDVACDVCTERKRKAVKSCLVCMASYCENHLQDHFKVPVLKKHKLFNPSKQLQENICSRHDEMIKILMNDLEKLSAAAERTEKQKELQVGQQIIQQRIQEQEKNMKLLQQEVEAINVSADKTVEDNEKIFTEMIRLIKKRRSNVKQQIRTKQETEVSRVKELQEKLEQEITELKRKDAELEKLLKTEDHNQFLQNYPSLSALSESTHSSSINIRPLRYFEDVTAAVSELREKLQDIMRDTWTNISQTVVKVEEPEAKTRAGFLKYSQAISLDPNTANRFMLLTEGERKLIVMEQQQSYSRHPDTFTGSFQVLSKESLTGRCYWEVEWTGGGVNVAVSYKNISRAGLSDDCLFGFSDKSWSLFYDGDSYIFWHKNRETSVSGPVSSRIGVFLDHRAGILSFYSVSGTMTLLHRVRTTFTQPLYAGIGVYEVGDHAEFVKLN